MIRLALLRLLESYFRHRWLNLLPLVLMSALAVIFILRSPPTYVAGGALFVQNDSLLSTLVPIGNSGYSWFTPAQLTANEIRELLRTEAFVRFAIQQTDLEARMQEGPVVVQQTIWQFRQSASVYELGDKLVGFSGQSTDPNLAYQIATATIDAYTEWKLNSERQDSLVAQAFFAEQLEPYTQALDQARAELQAYLDAHPAPIRGDRPEAEAIEIVRLRSAVDAATQRVKDTLSKEEEARLALSKAESEANRSYVVIDAPQVPTGSGLSLGDMLQSAIIFGVLGVGLSGAAVVGGMLIDRSLRLPVDVTQGLDLPLLAMIPPTKLTAAQPATAEEQQRLQASLIEHEASVDTATHTGHAQNGNGNGYGQLDNTDVEVFDSTSSYDNSIPMAKEPVPQTAYTSEPNALPTINTTDPVHA